MKRKVIPFLLLTVLLFTAACSKKNSAPAKTLTGYWVGAFSYGNAYPTGYYGIIFRPDGTVRIYEDADTTKSLATSEGTYLTGGATVATT